MSITEGMTPDAFLGAVKPLYEELQKQVFGNSAAPYGGNGNHDDDGSAQIDDYFRSKGGVWAEQSK